MARWVVITTSYPVWEGDPAGHFVRTEVRQLEAAGHAVEVLTPSPGGAFGWPGVAARLAERPVRGFDAVRWLARARARIGRRRPDAVQAHWVIPSVWPLATGLAASVAVHAVSHGADVRLLLALPSPLRTFLSRRMAETVSTWRFVGADLLDGLLAALPREARPAVARVARVAPSPLDLPPVAPRRLDEPFVVCVGRLVPGKRVATVVDTACREARALVVVGDGPERPALEAQARARGHGDRVHFVGARPRPEALAWIAGADALWHASRTEGCSTVAREAQALGVPVRWL